MTRAAALLRRSALACVLIPLTGIAAAAQQVTFDDAPITTCLTQDGGTACIGLGASNCTSADFGGSNVGYGLCFGAELRWWDAELNRTYTALIALFTTRDSEMDGYSSAAPRSVPALRTAQRAWIVWRDAACLFEATTWGGGSGAGPAETECLMRLTGEQALRLDQHLAESGG